MRHTVQYLTKRSHTGPSLIVKSVGIFVTVPKYILPAGGNGYVYLIQYVSYKVSAISKFQIIGVGGIVSSPNLVQS